MKTILVVGGAGFVGSHVAKMLTRAGYNTLVYDNLCRGSRDAISNSIFIEGDLGDTTALQKIFNTTPIDAVMHFAAWADVGDSFRRPLDYYINNVANTLNLLQVMLRHEVRTFIFSSSAAIFGLPQQKLIDESHPCAPISPYGQTKLMVEHVLKDMDNFHGMKSCCLRYFNAAGGDPIGEVRQRKIIEHNLIPIVLRGLLKGNAQITINGNDYPTPDGTCVRDYVHVCDIAQAHITALEQLFQGGPSTQFNLGNGNGFSILDVINTIEQVTGKKVQKNFGPRRQGDPPILVADARKAMRDLHWKTQYPSLDVMIEHAWINMQ